MSKCATKGRALWSRPTAAHATTWFLLSVVIGLLVVVHFRATAPSQQRWQHAQGVPFARRVASTPKVPLRLIGTPPAFRTSHPHREEATSWGPTYIKVPLATTMESTIGVAYTDGPFASNATISGSPTMSLAAAALATIIFGFMLYSAILSRSKSAPSSIFRTKPPVPSPQTSFGHRHSACDMAAVAMAAATGTSSPGATPRPPRSPFGQTTRRPVSPFTSTSTANKPTSASQAPTSAPTVSAPPQVFEVPPERRRPGAGRITRPHIQYHSLEDLFPGTGLAEAWDAGPDLGTAVRQAMRDDLYVPNPAHSEKAARALRSLGCTLVVGWRAARDPTMPALTRAFAEHGVQLTGAHFFATLTALTGPLVPGDDVHAVDWVSEAGAAADVGGTQAAGSLTDIAPLPGRRAVNHSWHCDSGNRMRTVLLGFPAEAAFDGEGVFSHVVRLSHPLAHGERPGAVIEWEQPDGKLAPVDEFAAYCVRPVYRRGQEIVSYLDSDVIHSAPDVQHRAALWRLM